MNATAAGLGGRKAPGFFSGLQSGQIFFLLVLERSRKCHSRYYCITIDGPLPVGQEEMLMLFYNNRKINNAVFFPLKKR